MVESNFQQDLSIVNNEIRSFIASLYKFFASNIENCDRKIIIEQIFHIISGVEVLLYKIDARRHELGLSISEVLDSDIAVGIIDPNAQSSMSVDPDPAKTRYNTSSVPAKSTYNKSSNRTFDVPEEHVGRQTFIAPGKRFNKTQVDNQDSINFREDFGGSFNVRAGTTGNLKRAQPCDDFQGLFKFED